MWSIGAAVIVGGAIFAWSTANQFGDLKQAIGQVQGTLGPRPEDPNQAIVKRLDNIEALLKPPEPQPKKVDEKGNPIPPQ
jgi:flagellar motor component MotA